jgi:hypothetical protein
VRAAIDGLNIPAERCGVWLCVEALCGLEEIMQNASTITSGMKNRMWDRMEPPSEEPGGYRTTLIELSAHLKNLLYRLKPMMNLLGGKPRLLEL